MPTRPPKPCSVNGCPNLTHQRYCSEHQGMERQRRKRYDKQRGTRHQRGYDHNWVKIRAVVLQAEPLCRECKRPAVDVHHSVKGNHNPATLVPLCRSCHNSKTRRGK